MARPLEKILYTAHTHTTGGRDGAGKSSDGAHQACPYSRATRGNIVVTIELV